ncbi:NADH dehydrogenase [ubiquinone] 1 subunit C2 [Drosophila sulfurigaster albostrigata]|uniref:NADH dehydrogenase [ubiquinone] 1 subunit C2 n=1 Tax=Drosophila albomicans TaxID=7291 RepID=A0A6P8WGZ3_DROAB|nr:NADH dehydrogenase [ubiquinone] 1 subunit C2 [Drosophila albomicans]XP_060651753.1 NADH dehydrogenase [ubiquinone] 1 subunit C2 [Drosophila nasuta]XP_062142142.1 NADH dehydrogenase [ubiquinone] 1 subunit C2 [Drosophila sulfurigaster albostrigata]
MNSSPVNDPLELLTNKGNRQPTFLAPIWNPIAGAVAGFGVALFVNWGFRKPVFSGIQKHIAFTLLGGALGSYFDNKRDQYVAKRDAVLRHYIELHPDDFPKTNRKKYGEVLESWVPVR